MTGGEERTRAHLTIDGRVQGVWFRAETRKAARTLGLVGMVRNMPDGTVKSYLFRARRMLRERLTARYKREDL